MTLDKMLAAIRAECTVPTPESPAMPDGNPLGWSARLGREVYEAGAQPGTWVETEASAALCIWCPEPLAEGDRLGCEQHRTPPVMPSAPAHDGEAVTPAISRTDLLVLAERRGWEALPLGQGVKAGGTEAMWRTFADNAPPAKFHQAVLAALAAGAGDGGCRSVEPPIRSVAADTPASRNHDVDEIKEEITVLDAETAMTAEEKAMDDFETLFGEYRSWQEDLYLEGPPTTDMM